MNNPESFQVDEKTLAQTNKCEKGFSCLAGARDDLCRIDSPFGEKVVYVRCTDNLHDCSYWASFGDSQGLCTCPTRLELHKRYGI